MDENIFLYYFYMFSLSKQSKIWRFIKEILLNKMYEIEYQFVTNDIWWNNTIIIMHYESQACHSKW